MKIDARTQQEKERGMDKKREREGKTVVYANVTKMLIGFYFIQTKHLVTTTDKTDTTATTTEASEDKLRKKDRQKRHRNPSEWNLI